MVAVQHGGTALRTSKHETNIGKGERIVSAAGGGLMALAGLKMLVGRHPLIGLSLAGVGGYLARRGVLGHCGLYESLGVHADDAGTFSNPFTRELRTEHSMTVLRSPEEAYKLWRDRDQLLQFLPMMERIDMPDERHLHFVGHHPQSGERIAWDSEIVEDRPGELIAWRSSGQTAFCCGQVAFCPVGNGRGTIVRLEMRYQPAGGVFAAALAKLRGHSLDGRAREFLRRFKSLAETGEIPTNEGPFGQRQKRAAVSAAAPAAATCARPAERARDRVEEASRESFPASDAPAWSSDPAAG